MKLKASIEMILDVEDEHAAKRFLDSLELERHDEVHQLVICPWFSQQEEL